MLKSILHIKNNSNCGRQKKIKIPEVTKKINPGLLIRKYLQVYLSLYTSDNEDLQKRQKDNEKAA